MRVLDSRALSISAAFSMRLRSMPWIRFLYMRCMIINCIKPGGLWSLKRLLKTLQFAVLQSCRSNCYYRHVETAAYIAVSKNKHRERLHLVEKTVSLRFTPQCTISIGLGGKMKMYRKNYWTYWWMVAWCFKLHVISHKIVSNSQQSNHDKMFDFTSSFYIGKSWNWVEPLVPSLRLHLQDF